MSEDLIRRSDAIKAMQECFSVLARQRVQAVKMIEAIPSADIPQKVIAQITFDEEKLREIVKEAVERFKEEYEITDRPQGEWVPFEYGDERWHKCTACGVADKYIEYVKRPNGTTGKLVAIRNFCPNCGARMKGADDE